MKLNRIEHKISNVASENDGITPSRRCASLFNSCTASVPVLNILSPCRRSNGLLRQILEVPTLLPCTPPCCLNSRTSHFTRRQELAIVLLEIMMWHRLEVRSSSDERNAWRDLNVLATFPVMETIWQYVLYNPPASNFHKMQNQAQIAREPGWSRMATGQNYCNIHFFHR